MDWLWYSRFSDNFNSIWPIPLYYNSNNDLLIKNTSWWVDSVNYWKHPYLLELFNINDTHIAISDVLTNWNYKYYIFEWLWNLKYTSPEITFTGWPSSCNDFSYDPMFYDECNMYGFTEFCNMDMYWVCGWNPELKYNWENKIILETPFDSFSEENTYLTSLNTSPNENIDWFFTDQYVWNSDLQCRVYYKTDEIVPSCSWKLIQDWNSLYCNPNLTHFWITYNTPYFPYYINETTTDYLCWAIYLSEGTQWLPWLPWIDWIDWIDWINWVDWLDWTNWIDWTNGIDWVDWTDWVNWFSCWDINLNNINDLSEDKNNDWFFNTLDCYWNTWADWLDWIDWANWIDWINGIDWVNWSDWADWLNWETTQTLSDDTKWFWDWIFDKIGWLFSIDEDKITDLNNSLSWALDTWTSWFSIWEWWTSWINYIPWNKDYWTIINRNDDNLTCDMFNWDWSFAYYSNWSYDLSINLNNILDLGYADKVPFLEELLFIPNKILSFITNPLNNIFSTLRVFWWIWEKTYCYFGTLQTIQFQKHIMVWASFFWWEIIFTPWTLTILDYLILFFMWLPMLIITVRILLY